MTPETHTNHASSEGPGQPTDQQVERPGRFRAWMERVGLLVPKDGSDPFEHRRGEPRGFVAIWTMYLLGSSIVTFLWLGPPWRVGANGYSTYARTLLVCLMVGIVVIWPLIRLSQFPARCGGKRVALLDGAIVWLTAQALVWPQSIVAGWPWPVMVALSLVSLAWCMLTGAAIAWALGENWGENESGGGLHSGLDAVRGPLRLGRRSLVMIALAIVTVLGPGLVLFGGKGGYSPHAAEWLWMTSPAGAIWSITKDTLWTGHRAIVGDVQWRAVGLGVVLGAGAWALLLAGKRSVPADR